MHVGVSSNASFVALACWILSLTALAVCPFSWKRCCRLLLYLRHNLEDESVLSAHFGAFAAPVRFLVQVIAGVVAALAWILQLVRGILRLKPIAFVINGVRLACARVAAAAAWAEELPPVAWVLKLMHRVVDLLGNIVWAVLDRITSAVAAVLVAALVIAATLIRLGSTPFLYGARWLASLSGEWPVLAWLSRFLGRYVSTSKRTEGALSRALLKLLDTLGLLKLILFCIRAWSYVGGTRIGHVLGAILWFPATICEKTVWLLVRIVTGKERKGKEERTSARYIFPLQALCIARDKALQVEIFDVSEVGMRIRFPRKLGKGEKVTVRLEELDTTSEPEVAPTLPRAYGVSRSGQKAPEVAPEPEPEPLMVDFPVIVINIVTEVRWTRKRPGSGDFNVGLRFTADQSEAMLKWKRDLLAKLKAQLTQHDMKMPPPKQASRPAL